MRWPAARRLPRRPKPARAGAARVEGELRALFALDPAAQRATPLEIIRSLRREAGEVLRAAGVPEVVRDPFETRAFPDDVYGIVLKTPAELGDDELGGALLAWGLGKAKVLRARVREGASGRPPGPKRRGVKQSCNNRASAGKQLPVRLLCKSLEVATN